MSVSYSARTRRRSITKKALLVGISYHDIAEGLGSGEEWGSIPTSIPNVKKFKQFIRGELHLPAHCIRHSHSPSMLDCWGYTNIIVMTDEVGVEERLRPTEANLVRPFPQSYQTFTYPNGTALLLEAGNEQFVSRGETRRLPPFLLYGPPHPCAHHHRR